MALNTDGHGILRAIAEHPDAFPAVQTELNGLVNKLLIKQLKSVSTNLELFKRLYAAVGASNLKMTFDGMTASEISGLVKKVDPFSSHVKAATDLLAARRHLCDIAEGRASAATKPTKAPKVKAPKKATTSARSKIGNLLESEVHSGRPAPRKRAAST